MKKHYLLFNFIFYIPLLLSAQSAAEVNSLLDTWDREKQFMGEIMIMQGTEPVVHRYLGYKNADKEMLHEESSTFSIGGISQTFTAALVMMAVEENELTLDITIDQYLPNLPNSNQITIRHLLEHRSGLIDYKDQLPVYQNPSIGTSIEKLISPLEDSEPAFRPGERHQQVDTNYLILTHILEKVYGKDYQNLLEEKITGPKDLNNTFLTAVNTTKLRSKSTGHQMAGNELRPIPATHPLFTAGAGGISSTASDLRRFSSALFDEELLSGQRVESMKPKVSNDQYGMGLSESSILGKKAIGHAGNSNGFESTLLYFPEDGVTMVILMNRSSNIFDEMVTEITGAYFGVSAAPVVEEETFPEATPAATPRAKAAATNITGTYAFNPKLKITIFREGGELKARTGNQAPTVLEKVSGNIYKIKGTEGKIRFVTDNDVITHLIFEQMGFEQKAVKE